MESLQEISEYLSPNTRFDVKVCALNHVLRMYILYILLLHLFTLQKLQQIHSKCTQV